MSFFVDKIKRNFKDYGAVVTIIKIISKIFGIIFEMTKYRIYKKNLMLSNNDVGDIQTEFNVRMLEFTEDDIIDEIENEAEWLRNTLKERIKKGEICYCILDKDKLVGYNLISFNKVFMPLVYFNKKFNDKCAWSEHISIKKDYRKLGLAVKLRKFVFISLKNKGYKWLYGGCLTNNIASLKLARRLEFEEIADIIFYKIFGKKYWQIKRIKKND